jgi:hypothetical protein
MHEMIGMDGTFLTLTYNDESLPANESLVKEHLQLFIKRLRKFIEPKKIKYFGCGEYGDKTDRPHYHVIVIGWMPELANCYRPDGRNVASRDIERLWKYGNNTVGTVTKDSIQYVVGYIRKKIIGRMAEEVYEKRQSPFQLQSQKMGLDYAQNHKEIILESGITRDGVQVGVPRYYRKKLIDKDTYEEYIYLKKCEEKRKEQMEPYKEDLKYFYYDRASDQERRRKHMEASETLYKKGQI